MTGFFITATGTDIGKTFVTTSLLRYWRNQGLAAEAFKPLASGLDPDNPAGSDPAEILAALGQDVTPASLDRISPWRFRAPLAPNMAAALEGKAVDYAAIIAACQQKLAQAPGPMLVEGVGGLMAPVDDDRTVLDWLTALDLPSIVVAGSYLGSISHTLTALTVLKDRNRPVAALAVSETPGATVALEAVEMAVKRHFPDLPVVNLPRADSRAGVAALAALLLG